MEPPLQDLLDWGTVHSPDKTGIPRGSTWRWLLIVCYVQVAGLMEGFGAMVEQDPVEPPLKDLLDWGTVHSPDKTGPPRGLTGRRLCGVVDG